VYLIIGKIAKFAGKQLGYLAADTIIPGSGYALRKINNMVNVTNMLGSKATPERVEDITDLMEDAGDFVKDTLGDIMDSLF